MKNCKFCQTFFACPRMRVQLVSDAKLENPGYLRDLRNFTAGLNISPDHWFDWLVDSYRDFQGLVITNRKEVYLDTEVFDKQSIREWFRDHIAKPVPAGIRPRLREESRERMRVLATIISARYPFEAAKFGLANDNRPPEPNQ